MVTIDNLSALWDIVWGLKYQTIWYNSFKKSLKLSDQTRLRFMVMMWDADSAKNHEMDL